MVKNRRPKSVRPDVVIPSTVRPHVRPQIPPHSECWAQEWERNHFGRLGDVRRCRHGVVQILTETTSTRTAGPGTHWWRDLSRLWDRKTYRLAVAALQAAEDF